MTELVVTDLTFGYGDDPVLSGVSFTLDRPELVCVIGPNGVGKTTLVKCLNKLLKPNAGSVTLDGEEAQDFVDLLEEQDIPYTVEGDESFSGDCQLILAD